MGEGVEVEVGRLREALEEVDEGRLLRARLKVRVGLGVRGWGSG